MACGIADARCRDDPPARERIEERADAARAALGLGALTVFDVLRLDVARGLRDGRWTFSVDIGRDFWSVL